MKVMNKPAGREHVWKFLVWLFRGRDIFGGLQDRAPGRIIGPVLLRRDDAAGDEVVAKGLAVLGVRGKCQVLVRPVLAVRMGVIARPGDAAPFRELVVAQARVVAGP